jgi:DNA-binding protein H-NS
MTAKKRRSARSNGTAPNHSVGDSVQLTEKQTSELATSHQELVNLHNRLGSLVAQHERQRNDLLDAIETTQNTIETKMKRFAKAKKVDLNAKDQTWNVQLNSGTLTRVG